MTAFLEVVTRHIPSRPMMLERNRASVEGMLGDVTHTLLIDDAARGVAWANWQMRNFTPLGDYVWLLDDDDECICRNLPACLARLAEKHNTDLVIVRMDHGAPLGILPHDSRWGAKPERGEIGISAVIVHNELWMKCRQAWTMSYSGDYDFISCAYATAQRLVWHDCVCSRCQNGPMHGKGEQ